MISVSSQDNGARERETDHSVKGRGAREKYADNLKIGDNMAVEGLVCVVAVATVGYP